MASFVCLLFSSIAYGCKCLELKSMKILKATSDLAFFGKAILNEVDSANKYKRTTFEVQEIWMKGKRKNETRVIVESGDLGTDCEFDFKKGTFAIVFARKLKDQGKIIFETGPCMGTSIWVSEETIQEFNEDSSATSPIK